MRRVTLDFGACRHRDSLHQYLEEQFGFAEHYGENLDALFDLLTEYPQDIEIVFAEEDCDTCCDAVWGASGSVHSEEMQRYLKKVRRLIEDAAEENSRLYV